MLVSTSPPYSLAHRSMHACRSCLHVQAELHGYAFISQQWPKAAVDYSCSSAATVVAVLALCGYA